MSDLIEDFGFDKEGIRGGVWDKYKGKKGEVHRLGLIYTDPKAIFSGKKTHYEPKTKRFFFCKQGICCDKLGPAKYRMGCVIIKYSTDKLGTLVQPFEYALFPWIFGETTFVKLKSLNAEYELTTHDIKVACTNEDYQHLDITPCQESVWQKKDVLKTKILTNAKPVWDYVKKSIAPDLSIEEIKELFNMGNPAVDPSTKVNLDDVLLSM